MQPNLFTCLAISRGLIGQDLQSDLAHLQKDESLRMLSLTGGFISHISKFYASLKDNDKTESNRQKK